MDEVKKLISKTQPPIPYRIYYISKHGIRLGGIPIKGRFQWKSAHRVGRRILRIWARDLVTEHDTTQLATILQQWARDWSLNNDGANTKNGELPTPENILSSLIDRKLEHKAYFRQAYDSRDGSVISRLSEEIIKAVSYCLKRMSMKPATEWIFPDLSASDQGWDAICEWLFRRRQI